LLVSLTPNHICEVLRQYLSGTVTASQVEDWAEILEGRPGVEYGCGDERSAEVVADTLFRLSTPEINAPLTAALATSLIEELGGAL
jgi:hypothetical protein